MNLKFFESRYDKYKTIAEFGCEEGELVIKLCKAGYDACGYDPIKRENKHVKLAEDNIFDSVNSYDVIYSNNFINKLKKDNLKELFSKLASFCDYEMIYIINDVKDEIDILWFDMLKNITNFKIVMFEYDNETIKTILRRTKQDKYVCTGPTRFLYEFV